MLGYLIEGIPIVLERYRREIRCELGHLGDMRGGSIIAQGQIWCAVCMRPFPIPRASMFQASSISGTEFKVKMGLTASNGTFLCPNRESIADNLCQDTSSTLMGVVGCLLVNLMVSMMMLNYSSSRFFLCTWLATIHHGNGLHDIRNALAS